MGCAPAEHPAEPGKLCKALDEDRYMTHFRIRAVMLFLIVCALHALAPSSIAMRYVYDDLNRLAEVHYDDHTYIKYTYDAVGNREQKEVGMGIYTITVSAGTGGSIQPSTKTLYYGESQIFTITPSTGYHIWDVLVDGDSVGAVSSQAFSNVTAHHTLQASFAKDVFSITTSVSGNGTITPDSPSVEYGDSRTFTISPATGYHVADVTVDGVSQGAISSYTFNNVTANHSISATFVIDSFSISASVGDHGSISPSGQVSVDYSANQTFTITPATGYHVANVTVDGTSQGAITSYTFSNVTAAHTISATFAIDTFTITASAGTHGSISPSGQVSVDYGTNQTFTITPDPHYHIVAVSVDGASVGAVTSYSFTNVTAAHTISATFAIDTLSITASIEGGSGTISPSPATVEYGGSQTFTITPATNYCLVDVKVDGVSQGTISSYTFTNVTTNHTISALFNASVRNVTRSASYETIQAAYDAASTGDEIRVRDIQLAGSLIADRENISVTIDGGYDCTFASNPNKTTIIGSVNINKGTVTMLNCIVSN